MASIVVTFCLNQTAIDLNKMNNYEELYMHVTVPVIRVGMTFCISASFYTTLAN